MTTPTQRSQRQLRPFFIIFCDSTDSGPLTPRSLCLFSLRTALEDGPLTANRRRLMGKCLFVRHRLRVKVRASSAVTAFLLFRPFWLFSGGCIFIMFGRLGHFGRDVVLESGGVVVAGGARGRCDVRAHGRVRRPPAVLAHKMQPPSPRQRAAMRP